jgi:hypothetical protein
MSVRLIFKSIRNAEVDCWRGNEIKESSPGNVSERSSPALPDRKNGSLEK